METASEESLSQKLQVSSGFPSKCAIMHLSQVLRSENFFRRTGSSYGGLLTVAFVRRNNIEQLHLAIH